MTQQREYPAPRVGRAEEDHLGGSEDSETAAIDRFFDSAAAVLNEKFDFFRGPVEYTVQRRSRHDPEHDGHAALIFPSLRRVVHYGRIIAFSHSITVFSDIRYVIYLEREDFEYLDDESKEQHPFNFSVYSLYHFAEIKDALEPLAETLREKTGRRSLFHHRPQEETPGILVKDHGLRERVH